MTLSRRPRCRGRSRQDGPMHGLLTNSGSSVDVAVAPLTAGRDGAPALWALGRRPVIVFFHGSNGHRSETTIIVQELAICGDVVVTVDTWRRCSRVCFNQRLKAIE